MIGDPIYPQCAARLVLISEDFGAGTSQTHTTSVTPRSVEIHRNNHREADTATITLDLRDFPFDPRTFQAGGVSIVLADVGSPDGVLDPNLHLRFAGVVDKPKTTRGESGGEVVLECRDFTAYFADHTWAGGMIDVSVPLSKVLATIIAEVPVADDLLNGGIAYSAGVNTLVLSTILGRTKYAPHPGDDTWTVLCDLLGRAGLIPMFDADLLLIVTPDDVGADRNAAASSIDPVRAELQYGRDVEKLGYSRNFKEAHTSQIEVRAYDEQTRTTATARYPVAAIIKKKRITPKGKVKETAESILPYYVTGAYSAAALADLAKRIYTLAAREEIEIEIETASMADIDGVELASLGNGARLTTTIGASITTDILGMTPSEAIAELTTGDRALAADVAAAFVGLCRAANSLAVEFYVKEATHKWSREQGYRLTLTAINYVGGTS